jgi:hypothetical protein
MTEVKVPFYSISGFQECQWYRRALCIGQDFVTNHPINRSDDQSTTQIHESMGQALVASQTFDRSKFREHLVAFKQAANHSDEAVDIGDHFSCPLILEGHCVVEQSNNQSADNQPLIKYCKSERLIGGYTEFAMMLKQRYGFVSTQCGKSTMHGGSC